jgi:hypothetical protein
MTPPRIIHQNSNITSLLDTLLHNTLQFPTQRECPHIHVHNLTLHSRVLDFYFRFEGLQLSQRAGHEDQIEVLSSELEGEGFADAGGWTGDDGPWFTAPLAELFDLSTSQLRPPTGEYVHSRDKETVEKREKDNCKVNKSKKTRRRENNRDT